MKRTTAEGNVSNRYTEGNPTLGIPATVVGAEEMNNIQEEIVNVVLDAGITLNGADETQLLQALKIILKRGGDQLSQSLDDNQTNTDVTGAIFDKLKIKGARLLVDMFRRNDTQSANEIAELFISHNTESDAWELEMISHLGDTNTTFNITATGQIQYSTSNFGGTGYTGTLKVTNIVTLSQ